MEEKIKIYSLYLPFGIVGIWRNNQNNTTIYKLAISENFDGPIHSRDLHAFIIFDIKPCLIPFLIASIKGCINHPNGIEDILFAHREGEIEFIRHDLFMTFKSNENYFR